MTACHGARRVCGGQGVRRKRVILQLIILYRSFSTIGGAVRGTKCAVLFSGVTYSA